VGSPVVFRSQLCPVGFPKETAKPKQRNRVLTDGDWAAETRWDSILFLRITIHSTAASVNVCIRAGAEPEL